MKALFLFICMVLTFTGEKLYAQVCYGNSTVKSVFTRYKFDFEIKDVTNPDSALVSKIKIENYDYLRKPHERVEAKDHENGLILLLYSEDEVRDAKNNHEKRADVKVVTDVKFVSTPKINFK